MIVRTEACRRALRMLPVPNEGARALDLEIVHVPLKCACHAVMEAIVKIVNAGERLWSSAPPNPLMLSYHWYAEDGACVVFDGWRSDIRPALRPFSSEIFRMHILAQPEPGWYTLRVVLVQEWVRWFDDAPTACYKDVRIRVEGELSAATASATAHAHC